MFKSIYYNIIFTRIVLQVLIREKVHDLKMIIWKKKSQRNQLPKEKWELLDKVRSKDTVALFLRSFLKNFQIHLECQIIC